MGKTTIEWADHSVNPIRARLNGRMGHHCVKISAGCTNCYASRLQSRFGMPLYQANRRKDVELFLHAPALEEVRSRKKPTRYFWCDMTDMFLEGIPREWWKAINGVWMDTPQHVHMVLTKRPEQMRQYFSEDSPPPNVWAGVSVEDQATADERIPILLQTPASVRFISAEPLLRPVNIKWYLNWRFYSIDQSATPPLNWVIVGGESGPGARPCDIAWIRSIKDQCQAAKVSCFVKQLGSKPVSDIRTRLSSDDWVKITCQKDKKGGDPQEWPEDLRVREYPR